MRRREFLIAATGAAVAAVSLAPREPLASQATPSASPVSREVDERFMRMALAEAEKGDFPFGTVIVHDGEVLARGFNTGKRDDDPTAHGEMNAIRAFLAEYDAANLQGTTLYTSGEPCAMCTGAIIWCGIGRIVYAASVEQLAAKLDQIAISSQEIVDRETFAAIEITGGVLATEALALFP